MNLSCVTNFLSLKYAELSFSFAKVRETFSFFAKVNGTFFCSKVAS